ncbi:hypothetical protein EMIHUDRAFT_448668 [Emiliania huxleyi CCMP1516]|uniref:6-phosphofructo-2-kinase domain-containing protein n=2 Tax=Emiliania huxleyi TaxID=2903 RepID=A0A0D3I2I1_EMIH1|nr:hypothetical protein EMIHUDRAFT_448668 [Emiliania huxleyi CCMP1516]EOD05466.1 hypothetical protein EMIHUDRAFT_448668 [Emiliania huxleyi CCMP1516]|eukprot:XP_005757895.1 hypothetical protein EMIHUDRAFT_448668 [Emiliania huxleyi CCMP1516]
MSWATPVRSHVVVTTMARSITYPQRSRMREVERLLSAPPLVSIPSSRSRYAVNPMSVIGERVVIAMVGLPARGKSYTSRAIEHYFTFLGCPVKLFNAGSRRRDQGLAGAASSFFDPSNSDAKQQRDQLAMETLDDLLAWLEAPHACDETWSGCACGIFDATNTTVARRRAVIERCARAERLSAMPLRLVFVESICNDEEILRHSYRLKLSNGDYAQQDPERALVDFLARVREYEKVYETIGEDEAKGYEGELVASGCNTFLMSHLVSLLHAVHRDWSASIPLPLKALNELCFGSLESLPGGKLRHSFPEEYAARAKDPLHYRYPGVGGESYMDLVTNCREVVLALERMRTDVAVVCDVAVARVLLGYFTGTPIEQIPEIAISPGLGLVELVRGHSGFSIEHHDIFDVGRPSLLAS